MGVVPYPLLFVFSCLFLALVLGFLAGCALLRQRCKRKSRAEKWWTLTGPHSRVCFALLLGYEVTYLQFVETAMKLFHCRGAGAGGGGAKVLAADTQVTCYEGGHLWALLLAVPLFVLHSLVRPRCPRCRDGAGQRLGGAAMARGRGDGAGGTDGDAPHVPRAP